jgi:hypothetical protein
MLLHRVCQLRVNGGYASSCLSFSLEDLFGTKPRCKNEYASTIEYMVPVALGASFLLLGAGATVFLCFHINWRHFFGQIARFLYYFSQCYENSHHLFRFSSPSLYQSTDSDFSTPLSPQQAVPKHVISVISWFHCRVASVLSSDSFLIKQYTLPNVTRRLLRIGLQLNHRFAARSMFRRFTVLPATHEANRRSPFIPPSPCALSLASPVDNEVRAADGAVAQDYTELFISFHQMLFSYNFRRASSALRNIASVSVVLKLCHCAAGAFNYPSGVTRLNTKWCRVRRVVATVVLAFYIATAPLLAMSQVKTSQTCEFVLAGCVDECRFRWFLICEDVDKSSDACFPASFMCCLVQQCGFLLGRWKPGNC